MGNMLASQESSYHRVMGLVSMEMSVKYRRWSLLVCLLIGALMLHGCAGSPAPDGAFSVSALMADPQYDTEVMIYGEVSLLGELFCPCFELTSGGENVMVWYGLMVEDDGKERPAINVEDVRNGEQVVVVGELKTAGVYRSLNDFWARSIEK
jgi:hypothetical protein